jgi:hypothetical protein
MAPGSERPAGTDPTDMFACACTCGYSKQLNTWLEVCPQSDRHESDVAYEFSCEPVEP